METALIKYININPQLECPDIYKETSNEDARLPGMLLHLQHTDCSPTSDEQSQDTGGQHPVQ